MSLKVSRVCKRFGGLRAVHDVSFEISAGEVFGLIGPNGAGKTTLFNLMTGIYTCDEGTIALDGVDVTRMKPAEIAAAGIARTFQNIRLFAQMTVVENLLVAGEAAAVRSRSGVVSALFRTRRGAEAHEEVRSQALELLRVFDLDGFADSEPTSLSYGSQRRLEIARAMMLRPKVLLLDEPAAGMNYGEAEGLRAQLRWMRETFALTIVLVEHNMQVIMGASDRVHVLDRGETLAFGTPAEVRAHPKVVGAYLGEEP